MALTPAESAELMAFTQRMIQVIKSVSSPDAFNVGLNLGAVAGGSLADHLHQHVVPRWTGDANFITVVGDTRCCRNCCGRRVNCWLMRGARWTRRGERRARRDQLQGGRQAVSR